MKAIDNLVVFPNGQTEVGTGEPGYRCVQAYSIKYQDGGVSNHMTLKNLRGMARRDGQILIVCKTETEALSKL